MPKPFFLIALALSLFMACTPEDVDTMLPDPETMDELVDIADSPIISAPIETDPLPGTYSFVPQGDTLGWWRFHQPTISGIYPYGSSHPGTYEPLDSITHDVTLVGVDTMIFSNTFGNVYYTYEWINDSLLLMLNLEFDITFELQKWQ